MQVTAWKETWHFLSILKPDMLRGCNSADITSNLHCKLNNYLLLVFYIFAIIYAVDKTAGLHVWSVLLTQLIKRENLTLDFSLCQITARCNKNAPFLI